MRLPRWLCSAVVLSAALILSTGLLAEDPDPLKPPEAKKPATKAPPKAADTKSPPKAADTKSPPKAADVKAPPKAIDAANSKEMEVDPLKKPEETDPLKSTTGSGKTTKTGKTAAGTKAAKKPVYNPGQAILAEFIYYDEKGSKIKVKVPQVKLEAKQLGGGGGGGQGPLARLQQLQQNQTVVVPKQEMVDQEFYVSEDVKIRIPAQLQTNDKGQPIPNKIKIDPEDKDYPLFPRTQKGGPSDLIAKQIVEIRVLPKLIGRTQKLEVIAVIVHGGMP